MYTNKYDELSAEQIKKLIESKCILLISFGSIEQHGPHLPVGTDYICMEERVKRIAKLTDSIYFTPIQLGYSYNHIGMVGTISLSGELFISIAKSIFLQLFEQGWKRIIVFSGHNGNWDVLNVALRIAKEKYPKAEVVLGRGYPKMDTKHNENRFYKNFDMHAGVVETALVNFFRPDIFDFNNIPTSNSFIPKEVTRIIDKSEIDDIDKILLSAITPQHTELISSNGIWGRNDLNLYTAVPVKKAMEQYIDFYVNLINRWKGSMI